MKIQNDEDKTTIVVELSEVNDKMLAFAAQYGVEVKYAFSASIELMNPTCDILTSREFIDFAMKAVCTAVLDHRLFHSKIMFAFTDKRIATLFYMRFK